MVTLGGPISFQTEAPRVFGCRWKAVVARGVSLGAGSIEVWPVTPQGFLTLTLPEMQTLASELVTPIPVPPDQTIPPTCTGFQE